MAVLRWIHRWAHTSYALPERSLAWFRIVLAAFLLVHRSVPDLRWIAGYPSAFHDPAPGMPSLWGGFLTEPVYLIVEVALLSAIVALGFGVRTPISSVAVGGLGILANAMLFTFGKIDHTILLWLTPLLMANSGWGNECSVDRRTGRIGSVDPVAPALVAVSLAFGFATAAAPKLLGGWLSPGTKTTFTYLVDGVDVAGRDRFLAEPLRSTGSHWGWEVVDWATIVFEAGFAISVLWPRWFRVGALIAMAFHVVNLLVLNISFESLYPIYLVPLLGAVSDRRVGWWLESIRSVPALAWLAFGALGLITGLIGRGLWHVGLVELAGISQDMADLVFLSIWTPVMFILFGPAVIRRSSIR